MGKHFGSVFKVLGLSCCVIGLSACAEMSHVWDGMTTTDVTMREDNGSIMAPLTPELLRQNQPSMPTGYNLQGGVHSSVDIAGVNAISPMHAGHGALMQDMNISGDSSVTVFPLDGVAPSMSLGGPSPSQTSFYEPSYEPSYAGGSPQTQIFFKHGSSRLGGGDMRKLSQVAQGASMSSGRISVEGHASRPVQTSDPVRSSILNLKESMNRAFAVSKTLIQKGVPAAKLKTTAYGDTVPVGSEGQQRRVDIISGGY